MTAADGMGSAPLIEGYDAVLVDLDGVVYRGARIVAHAPEALAVVRARGRRVGFVTNNAFRPPEAVAAHLTELGIPATAADVVTSAQAAARLVAEIVPAGAAVLVIGGAGLDVALAEHGLRAVRSLADSPRAVVQGYSPDVDWRQLAEASYAVQQGLAWVAANVDPTLPTERGLAPGNGTLVAAVKVATGAEPLVAGKPQLPLHREAVIRTGASRPLVVGDRLDTDIEGANRAGADSLLVLTGVTTPLALIQAGPARRPTHVAADLRGLLVPAPSVEVDDGTATCAGWTVRVDGQEVKVLGEGNPVDGLRALCAAVWSLSKPMPDEAVADAADALAGPGSSGGPPGRVTERIAAGADRGG